MDNNMFQRLKDLVTQHQTIGILTPPNASLDEMGAALGMYLALKQMGKDVSVVSPTDITVGVSSLVGIDKVAKGFGGATQSGNGDLVVTFPYREGEIEKVSYTVDNGQLNIVVKAGANGLSFNQSDVRFQQGGGATTGGAVPPLVFAIGIADQAVVTSLIGQGQQVSIVNIDNKPNNPGYGDVVHVSAKFSSVSEMVADFLTLLEPQIELDADTAQDLLSGLLSATNDFQNGQGSYLAFEMAGILMKKGAVRSTSGSYAKPTTPQMATSSYFPPQNQGPVQQPVQQQPAQQQPMMPMPSFMSPMPQPFSSAQGQQQATQPFAPNPTQAPQPMQQAPVQQQQPFTQPAQQQQSTQQPPADWLSPKVYKGSTVL